MTIPLFKVFMAENVLDFVGPVLKSGYVGQGPKVEEFEAGLCDWFGVKNLLTVNSATSAEHLALRLLKYSDKFVDQDDLFPIETTNNWMGVSNGDTVLASPLTCLASNMPIILNNYKIRWCDIDVSSLNMDLADVEAKISQNTKAIMFPLWGGMPPDIDKINDMLDRAKRRIGFRPFVIFDCAHAIGSTYRGRKIGTQSGFFFTFSFQAIKHFTTGDGGILISPYKELQRKGKLLRWYSLDREEKGRQDFRCEMDAPYIGDKLHMNDINASIGLANLPHIDAIIQKHKDNAAFYNHTLSDISGIKLLRVPTDRESASWIFTLKAEKRDDLMRALTSRGIMCSRVHERNDKHSCFTDFKEDLPGLEEIVKEMLCIPVGWWLSETDRQYVVDSIKKGW